MSLLRTAGRAAVASSVHGRVQRRQQQRWAAQGAAAPAAPVPAAPAPAPAAPAPAPAAPAPAEPAGDARSELMVSLTALRNAGVVTDAEFAAISGRIFA
ncbi:hypothetical protein GOPIP_088_00970 [Gordonia polyisoprenivorans NBRC 16320 = JCM 10675]|uniref:SHOCT domain-containing protein n=1 Tax=Gordonia polyisoprenivorans TaxID=84595 RepID=A0A846WH50_9ACTN|nr:hypothetical protein [Gordonia polyisoprenivorans]NKY00287.1 hypothetical protein [Gordonia polyisoprenivorans]OZC33940.1 hypothetical protein CJJ17_22410 [Gordonia polyisoprenivorans]GAB25986.1 hypothetical protein GOPIP_088_00970 [Gordonia polyisoprenivorans NBRC 16320 = JCM 10675]